MKNNVTRPGKQSQKTGGKITMLFSWVKQLFQWPFSIANKLPEGIWINLQAAETWFPIALQIQFWGLVSNSELRYEGILYTINTQDLAHISIVMPTPD